MRQVSMLCLLKFCNVLLGGNHSLTVVAQIGAATVRERLFNSTKLPHNSHYNQRDRRSMSRPRVAAIDSNAVSTCHP
jgi:hypothetical protein